jgi:membrane protein YdbS with pleckstrin-like domain
MSAKQSTASISDTNVVAFSNQYAQYQDFSVDTLTCTPVAAHYPITRFTISVMIIFGVTLVALLAIYQPFWFLPETGKYWVVRGLSVAMAIWFAWTLYFYFADKRLGYCLREQDITLFKGLIFRKQITQPICRIQHIELQRGPVDRKVGLAQLHIFSAGDLTQTFIIPGLPEEDATAIRNTILAHKELQHHG